jgi:hypothetical protein
VTERLLKSVSADPLAPAQPALRGCAHSVVLLHTEAGRAWWACRDCDVPFSPAVPSDRPPETSAVDGAPGPEYISLRELTNRIPYADGTIRNLMSSGVLKRGEHYVKPNGRVMFRWSAVQAWLGGPEPGRG